MPKINGTQKQKRKVLFDRISPDYLFNKTSIFTDPIGGPQLDQYTVDMIKSRYSYYFFSWVEQDAKRFVLQEKSD